MGLDEFPEVKLARKILAKHSLKIPFDIVKLVKEYANLLYKEIPFVGIDGVSINIKVPGKTPTIIVNTSLPPKRQLFTLAHELGHIIIPWHLGTIVDDIYSQSYKDYQYSLLEQEANRFAAELLMPLDWVLTILEEVNGDIALLHRTIATDSGASDQSAAIRLIETLPQSIIYTAEENGTVLHTGKTDQTDAFLQENGGSFSSNFYPYIDSYSTNRVGSICYHWWQISTEIDILLEDNRTWREILNQIAKDINPSEGEEQFKKSINGIVAHAHGKIKLHGNYNINSVISACIYRLRRTELNSFTSHPDFEAFVKMKVEDMFNKKK